MNLRIILLFLVFAISGNINSQCLNGRVIDKTTGLAIPFATVQVIETGEVALTDSLGRFSLCDTTMSFFSVEVSHLSYIKKVFKVDLNKISRVKPIIFQLSEKNTRISEIEIESKQKESTFSGNQLIRQKDILKLPNVLGEADVIRAIQLLPGVQSVGEGIGGVFVRGGSAGQNLFVYDDMEILNPSHLMGIFSVFNPMTTSGVELFKGNAPVELQEDLSSTILVKSKQPAAKEPLLAANIGNISSSVGIMGLSKNEKFSYVVGARRSFLELFNPISSLLIPDKKNYFKKYGYNFYDFNGTLKWYFTPAKILSVSWYTGKDDFVTKKQTNYRTAGSKWGNTNFICSYQYPLSSNVFAKHSLSYASVNSEFDGAIFDNSIDYQSSLAEMKQKNSLNFYFEKHHLNMGLDFFFTSTVPENMDFLYMGDSIMQYERFFNVGAVLYAGDDIKITDRLKLYAGMRGTVNLSKEQSAGKFSSPFYSWSPTLALSRYFNNEMSLKIAYSRNTQQLHLCSFSSIPTPNDVWMNSTPVLKPEISHQLSIGYYQKHKSWNWSVETYGKLLKNQLILNLNIDDVINRNFENNFYIGEGIAYGIDFFLAKTMGKLTGSIAYSLARSIRSYPDIMDGAWFNDKYDRTHDLKFLIAYKLSKKWSASVVWVYATGNMATLPVGRWWMMGSVMNDYDGINNVRLPAYHRLDIAANYRLTTKHFKESVLGFSIINVYNRANPYYLVYQVAMDKNQYNIQPKVVQTSLFPFMPSINWRFSI